MGDSRPPGTPSPDNSAAHDTPSPISDPTTPSAIFGDRYRIERVIGEGAFGRVYLAFDGRLRRNVAIKELLASRHSTDPATYQRYVQRFEREARATSVIQHPNAVTVYDLHVDAEGNNYLVLEYVDGTNLRDLLTQVGTLPVSRAVAITRDMASALEAVHEQEIVHRDVKPANIMITRRGVAKLMDFGIAQVGHESLRTQITAGHPGTPLYMSPEQSSGYGYIDGRSDLYALGLVLYEMVVGEPYLRRRRPLGVARPEVPAGVVRIVEKLLAQDVNARYADATELLRDLGGLGKFSASASGDAYVMPGSQATQVDLRPVPGWDTGSDGAATIPIPGVPSAYGGLASKPPAGAPVVRPDSPQTIVEQRVPGYREPARVSATQPLPSLGNAQVTSPGLVLPIYPPTTPAQVNQATLTTKRQKSPWIVPLLMAIALIVIGGASVGAIAAKRHQDVIAQQSRDQQAHYDAADRAFAQGDYQAAVQEFGAAGNYQDASQRQADAQQKVTQQQAYADGVAAVTRGDFSSAATAFLQAGNYQDAPQRRVDAQQRVDQQQAYADGLTALAKEDYATAATAFLRAGNYKDAPQQATQAQTLSGQSRQYRVGEDAIGRGDYVSAVTAFRAAGTFKDAPQRASGAETLRDQKTAYDAGVAAFSRSDFKAAKQQFLAAGTYKDAPTRAAQAEQEDTLLTQYNSAQGHLKASQWREAYADLQQIQRIRSPYKDVNDIIRHLENDVANPITIDLYSVLNQGNGYKRGAIPINSLIGKPLAYIVIARDWTYDNLGRPDLVSSFRVYIQKTPDSPTRDNTDVPVLAASDLQKYRDSLDKDERLVVVTGNGQVIDVQNFGAYHAKLTVKNVAIQARPTTTGNGTGTDPIFTRIIVDVALTSKSP